MSQTWNKLQTEMKESLKSGNKERLEVIRMLISEIKNVKVNTPGGRDREWAESEITPIVSGYHKTLIKTLAEFPPDRQEKLKKEIAIVEDFLPKQLTSDEIKEFVAQAMQATSERNFGALMKIIQPQLAGRADGKVIAESIKNTLANLA